uniref:Cytotoxin n=1 Tax=Strigamia maritima TaxID=126957 RepID=T1IT03_STRMM
MNCIHVFICSIVVCATIISSVVSSEVDLDNFDDVAKQYAEKKAKEYERTLVWYDIYGTHQHLAERDEYKKYKIGVWSDDVEYGKIDKTIEKPGHIYTQWYHNAQSVPITAEFSREVELKSSYSWSKSSNFKMGVQVDVSVAVPQIFLGVNVKINTSLELQNSKSETIEQTETYGVKNVITIPPKKSVKAEFIVTEKDVQIPWSANVEITGYIAMWFEPKYNDHWLWFHPITALANDKFKKSEDGKRLIYHAKGLFRGLRGIDSTLKTSEYDVADYHANNSPRKFQRPTNVKYTKPI